MRALLALTCAVAAVACGGTDGGAPSGGVTGRAKVQVVLFTHIEDNTPGGQLGSSQSKTSYLTLRTMLIEVAQEAAKYELRWVLQPDWKFLEAARQYEDAATTASTGGKNVFVYLQDTLGVVIDPHSHESGGYNYTDVAHLLELLGVGGSTVIGGHIWDPALPQFQHWERFRQSVKGTKYPSASWRGDILIGSGTPNHVNDPIVSGLWRPKQPDDYWTDDPTGNIVAVGAYHDSVVGVQKLVELQSKGTVSHDVLLTASWNVTPKAILATNGPADIAAQVFAPLADMQSKGTIEVTDFRAMVTKWQNEYGGRSYLYRE
jgi:hypothetical protein